MRRVEPFDVTQVANLLLSESFSSVERSMPRYYRSPKRMKLVPCPATVSRSQIMPSGGKRRHDAAFNKLEGRLVFVFFKELFGVQRGHASRSCGRDRLPVAVILHVPGDKHTGNGSQAPVLGD